MPSCLLTGHAVWSCVHTYIRWANYKTRLRIAASAPDHNTLCNLVPDTGTLINDCWAKSINEQPVSRHPSYTKDLHRRWILLCSPCSVVEVPSPFQESTVAEAHFGKRVEAERVVPPPSCTQKSDAVGARSVLVRRVLKLTCEGPLRYACCPLPPPKCSFVTAIWSARRKDSPIGINHADQTTMYIVSSLKFRRGRSYRGKLQRLAAHL